MVFSEQLSKLRKEANLTQEDLAEKCDVSRQAVAKWESGESLPDIYKISQIAKIFEVLQMSIYKCRISMLTFTNLKKICKIIDKIPWKRYIIINRSHRA